MIEKYSVPFNKIESLKNGADWIDNNKAMLFQIVF